MGVHRAIGKGRARRLTVTTAVLTAGLGLGTLPAQASTRTSVIVGFGDSVPAGAHCSCKTFVQDYANSVAAATGTKAKVDNYAESGSTSADVVSALSRTSVRRAVSSATTVIIMTGANDYESAFAKVSHGASAGATYAPVARRVKRNVTAAIKKIHSINPHVDVVVLDYWGAMKDGKVAQKTYSARALKAAAEATTSVNNALHAAAKAEKAIWVSTFVAFKGIAGDLDPTKLLASDGDHPDAAGTSIIAATIAALLPNG